VSEGEMVLVKSRRGQVELAVKIDEILPGHVIIPFHFGYFDSKDQRARAANELTTGNFIAIFERLSI
jgi:anaerobic selenocysteine-containing dehydrogenase